MYHVAIQEGNAVKGYVYYAKTRRLSAVRHPSSADGWQWEQVQGTMKQYQAYMKKGTQSKEEWQTLATKGPNYGKDLHILCEETNIEESGRSNHATVQMHLIASGNVRRQADLHRFLKTMCKTFMYYHTDHAFECQLHLHRRTRPSTVALKCKRALTGTPCVAYSSQEDLDMHRCKRGPWTEKTRPMSERVELEDWQRDIIESFERGKTIDGNIAPITTLATKSDFPINDQFLNTMVRDHNFAVHRGKTHDQIQNAFMNTPGEKDGYVFLMEYALSHPDCLLLESVKRGCVLPALGKSGEPRILKPPFVFAMCEEVPKLQIVESWKQMHMTVVVNQITNHYHFQVTSDQQTKTITTHSMTMERTSLA